MKIKSLNAFINGSLIGTLHEDASGRHSFTYCAEAPAQLSLSMPRRSAPWTGKPVEAYIDGILPDSRITRQHIADLYDVNANNPFSLLTAVGLDCPGGVQFTTTQALQSTDDPAQLTPISDTVIGERLRNLSSPSTPGWLAPDEHWSLGGAQGKIALRRENGAWYTAQGSAATTHILKPGVQGLHEQAFNEYICMETLKNLSIPTAVSRFMTFSGVSAIVSTRWDRKRVTTESGSSVQRIHQEDLCQAMSYMTREKYQNEGGPGAVDIVRFMQSNNLSGSDIMQFAAALILNFLIGGTDAHAKNYALLEQPGSKPRLAPLYDVASIFAYDTPQDRRNERKLAMSIGGEYNYDRIELRHWRKFAQDVNLPEEDVVNLLQAYSKVLPDAFAQTGQHALTTTAPFSTPEEMERRKQLISRIEAGIVRQCDRMN